MSWLRRLISEPPLRVQYGIFLATEFVWIMSVGFVAAKGRAYGRAGREFADAHLVYMLVLLWMPLVLSCGGLSVLLRHRRRVPAMSRSGRGLYRVVIGLTAISVLVVLICGPWAASLPGNYRE